MTEAQRTELRRVMKSLRRNLIIMITISMVFITAYEYRLSHIVVPRVNAKSVVQQVFDSVVHVGASQNGQRFSGTGWVVASESDISYVITAAHVVYNRDDYIVGYWDGHMWQAVPAVLVGGLYGSAGDVAVLMIPIKLPALNLAINTTVKPGEEVIAAGIHPYAPPAYPTVGQVDSIQPDSHTFRMNAWAYRGHSGGPVILKRTHEVIGIIVRGTEEHNQDGTLSECTDYTRVRALLATLGVK